MRGLSPLIRFLARLLPLWLALPALFACGADSLKPVVREEPGDVYWNLALNHQALTMGPPGSPYDTITLTATPRNVAGEALTGLPAPTYRSGDITKVTVTPEGFVRVLGSGFEPVWVVATLVSENVRHTDSVRVRSVDVEPPPVLGTLSIQPVPPDSAKRALGASTLFAGPGFPPLPVHVADVDGIPLTDVMVSFRSLDSLVSLIDENTGKIDPVRIGSVDFTASATMFGIMKTDTVRYRVGFPLYNLVAVASLSSLIDTISSRIGVGGEVWFSLPTAGTIDFDSADLPNIREAGLTAASHLSGFSTFTCFLVDCGSGNVPLGRGAVRTFTAPGTYYYHITFADSVGVVRVGRVNVVDEG